MNGNQTQSVLSKVAAQLKDYEGERITIIKFSEFGFLISIQGYLSETEIVPYGHNKETMNIIYRPNLRLNSGKTEINADSDLIIYKGWVKTNIDNTHQVDPVTLKTLSVSNYKPFDKRYLKEILYTMKADVIIQMIDGKLYEF